MSELDGMIESAMKDPRFAQILSSLKEKSDRGELDPAELISEISGGGAAQSGGAKNSGGAGLAEHKKLLAALRPYLGEQKRGAVDSILKIGEYSGLIEALAKKDGR